MSLKSSFDPSVPFYRQGKKYGVPAIEKAFDHVETLMQHQRSPINEGGDVSYSEIVAELSAITEDVDPQIARPYLDDIVRCVAAVENWRNDRQNKIYDDFFDVFDSIDLKKEVSEWASQVSAYYPVEEKDALTSTEAMQNRVRQARRDLKQAIQDMRGKPLESEEVSEAWLRGEDAFYYLIGNDLAPATPKDRWERYAAQGAYLFSVDNRRHNRKMQEEELVAIGRAGEPEGPFTDKELEKLVKFEGTYPGMRASEFGFLLDHKLSAQPYDREMSSYFGKSIHFFNNLARTAEYDPNAAI